MQGVGVAMGSLEGLDWFTAYGSCAARSASGLDDGRVDHEHPDSTGAIRVPSTVPDSAPCL